MGFTWPLALLALVAVPLLAGVYVGQLRRRRRQAVRYSSVALIKAAAPRRAAWKRHVPVALLLAALAALGRSMFGGAAPGPAELAGTFVLAAFGLLLLGSLLQRVRMLWHTQLRGLLVRTGAALWAWTGKVWPRGESDADARPPMGAGDRIAAGEEPGDGDAGG